MSRMVDPGSRIRTDGWNGYHELEKLGYKRQVARKEASEGDTLYMGFTRTKCIAQ
jgi:hypothetical protein